MINLKLNCVMSIYNILHNNKLTQKRVRSKFYPEKHKAKKK